MEHRGCSPPLVGGVRGGGYSKPVPDPKVSLPGPPNKHALWLDQAIHYKGEIASQKALAMTLSFSFVLHLTSNVSCFLFILNP